MTCLSGLHEVIFVNARAAHGGTLTSFTQGIGTNGAFQVTVCSIVLNELIFVAHVKALLKTRTR